MQVVAAATSRHHSRHVPSSDSPTARTPAPSLQRLRRILAALEDGLVERRAAVRLALLAALAGEHTLLVGPPGTAKSLLARRLHLAFAEGGYFERLLTRFTVPEELFGPLSIRALEEDRYERQTEGFLPRASIAFIDEVFKANSAILNALLTLLNEREFDNGPRREPSPLVTVIGATNAVPEDEEGEAFVDRFLVRVPVAPVSGEGFLALLAAGDAPPAPLAEAVTEAERVALARAAREVQLPAEVTALLAEARARLAADGLYVSDRRWVKIAGLLRVAAAAEGRAAVACWDLWLLPWCVAADPTRLAAVGDWLAARLGVREALSPPRLTRVVEAFEAQLEAERQADDLDYDDDGRLRLSDEPTPVGDTKGAAAAPRLSFTRRRRYGESHVAARRAQLDDLDARVDAYLGELSARREELAAFLRAGLWMDEGFGAQAAAALAGTVEAVAALRARARRARDGFEALPRLPADPGLAPPPIAHEPLETGS
jgi:MoxR-like ATPase